MAFAGAAPSNWAPDSDSVPPTVWAQGSPVDTEYFPSAHSIDSARFWMQPHVLFAPGDQLVGGEYRAPTRIHRYAHLTQSTVEAPRPEVGAQPIAVSGRLRLSAGT